MPADSFSNFNYPVETFTTPRTETIINNSNESVKIIKKYLPFDKRL